MAPKEVSLHASLPPARQPGRMRVDAWIDFFVPCIFFFFCLSCSCVASLKIDECSGILIGAGADVQEVCEDGFNHLMVSHLPVMLCPDLGASHSRDSFPSFPFPSLPFLPSNAQAAARLDRLEALEVFLKHLDIGGKIPRSRDSPHAEQQVLHLAAAAGAARCVRRLLTNPPALGGAPNPNSRDALGRTPLHLTSDLRTAEELLRRGARCQALDARKRSALCQLVPSPSSSLSLSLPLWCWDSQFFSRLFFFFFFPFVSWIVSSFPPSLPPPPVPAADPSPSDPTQELCLQWQQTYRNLPPVKCSRGTPVLDPGNPAWIDDAFSKSCLQCGDPFTFINRKHHCRMCGQLVCGDCSFTRSLVEGSVS